MSSERSSSAPQRLTSGDVPVAIRMYARSLEAALDVATLESHGIPAQIMGDNVGDTLNWYGLAVQKVELVVPRLKAAEAQKILAEQAAQHSDNQRTDWVCSGCSEVNGSEFDSCWSCGKIWSMELDQEHVAKNLAQPLPTANDAVYVLPDQDENPYAPPIAGTVVIVAHFDRWCFRCSFHRWRCTHFIWGHRRCLASAGMNSQRHRASAGG